MNERDYVISVVLSNEDWKAFLQVQPEPVNWLRERIRESIEAARQQSVKTQATPAAH